MECQTFEYTNQEDTISKENSDERELFTPNKRRSSCVPELIDNKRKHLERNLSAAQRDQLLMKEAKEDTQFRRDLAEAMRQSTASFSECIKDVSKSMSDLGAGVCRSIEMLSHALMQQTQPVNQNMFYQPHAFQPPQNMQGMYIQMLNQPECSQTDPKTKENTVYKS